MAVQNQPSSDDPQGTARIRGRVVSAETGSPLRDATVHVAAERLRPRETTTDSEGRYELDRLPGGAFSLSAWKDGYLAAPYGQRRLHDLGTAITLDDGQTAEGIDFSLSRPASIAVRVVDDSGKPVPGTRILVQRFRYTPGGERRLTSSPLKPAGPLATDDRGDVRVSGLPPGEYVLRADVHTIRHGNAAAASTDGFSPTYYPGTINAEEAQPVAVGVGQEISLQFTLVRTRLGRASGIVFRSDGTAAAGMELWIGPAGETGGMKYGAGSIAEDGTFAIVGIPPGEYVLEVRESRFRGFAWGAGTRGVPGAGRLAGASPFGDSRGETALVPLTVGDADIEGLLVVTSPGTTVEGTVVFEGTSPRPTGDLEVFALPPGLAGGGWFFVSSSPGDFPPSGRVDAEGRFRITGASGRKQFDLSVPGWMLKAVTLGGRDITDEVLDFTGTSAIGDLVITMTDRLTAVSGHVRDRTGEPGRRSVVVLLPADPRPPDAAPARIHRTHTEAEGRFTIARVRPGRYVAAALDALESGRESDPTLQQRVRFVGRMLIVEEGQTATVDLDLMAGP